MPSIAATVTAGIKCEPSEVVRADSVPASTIKPLPVTPTAPLEDTIKMMISVMVCSSVNGISKACPKKITARLR